MTLDEIIYEIKCRAENIEDDWKDQPYKGSNGEARQMLGELDALNWVLELIESARLYKDSDEFAEEADI